MDFVKLAKQGSALSREYKSLIREKEENAMRERLAAVTIQKCYRGYLTRRTYLVYKHFLKRTKNAIDILACKFLLRKLKQQRLEQQAVLYLSDNATKIQKVFRGYYSRKYIHDFFRRKREILEMDAHVKAQKGIMLQGIEEKRKKQLIHDNKVKDTKIHNAAKNLHHLVSTKAQRGVYNYRIENIIREQQEKIKNSSEKKKKINLLNKKK
ncbi:Calmodulin binding protein [Plasmodium coatneyi]|uniref:Calmodulin binding protein n=1 Tax=Plasmodium coatneyi TaxID=208452 RepID=A0A1B1DZJ7_9APIC|nr:Calmodulin binding protein [Plasmodium coatneyi]ANQ08204.1 Calmodulin binding protein [Plasmodium coatneyi]